MPTRSTPMPRAAGPKSTPFKSSGDAPTRKAMKRRSRYTGPSGDVRTLLLRRSDGLCEIGLLCFGNALGVDPAHRMPKQAGGTKDPRSNLASNLLWACRACHDLIDRAKVAESYVLGYKIRGRKRNPSEVPVKHWVHGWAYLLDDGTVLRSAVTATGEVAL